MAGETQREQTQREVLLLEQVRAGACPCGYRIARRQGIFPAEYAREHGIAEVIDDFPRWALDRALVAAGDKNAWLGMFAAIERGSPTGSAKLFLAHGDGYRRYMVQYSTFRNEAGEPFFAMLFLVDIDREYDGEQRRLQDIECLLCAARKTYPEILAFNLTRGTYRIISFSGIDDFLDTEQEGLLADMNGRYLDAVYKEDREAFLQVMSPEALQRNFVKEGRESMHTVYRRRSDSGAYAWHETIVQQQPSVRGEDVLVLVMTHDIDEHKAEEVRLADELWLQTEELRLTSGKMNRGVIYYDFPTRTLTVPGAAAMLSAIPSVIHDYPDSIAESFSRQHPDAWEPLCRLNEAMLGGESAGTFDLPFRREGEVVWTRVEFATLFDQEGRPRRAVLFTEDVTAQYRQADENERLRYSQEFLRMVAHHSDRAVFRYDVTPCDGAAWYESAPMDHHLLNRPEITVITGLGRGLEELVPESGEALRRMFRDIHAGVPNGELRVHCKAADDVSRWMLAKYSTIFGDDGAPGICIISLRDNTEEYERELTYLRHVQAMQVSEGHLGTLEVDLETGLIETLGGRMIPPSVEAVGRPLTDVAEEMMTRRAVHKATLTESLQFFDPEYLISCYVAGLRRVERTWQVYFHNGIPGWIHVETDLVLDPYSLHRKVFFRLTDITDRKTAELEILDRSEHDGMTGLLNRAAAEGRVQACLAEDGPGGILILLDLDDLKGINDTYGHDEGDRAIRSIAETLKVHFREGDVVARMGGDEFMVFLPGAAENPDAIAASLSNLLRKLIRIPIGTGDDRRLHCSIGCAVQTGETEGYEALFKQADMALYAIKRSGKNNYAFYIPEMEERNNLYLEQRLLSRMGEGRDQLTDLRYLPAALTNLYEAVFSMNLTTNDYVMMEEDRSGIFAAFPKYGAMDHFVAGIARGVHPDDAEELLAKVSREPLLTAYANGERSLRCYCRFFNGQDYQWVEAAIIFYTNDNGDVCEFVLIRWAGERSAELDRLVRINTLERAVVTSFETVWLIDRESGVYTMHSSRNNRLEMPLRGTLEQAALCLAHRITPEEDRERFCRDVTLERVLSGMEEGGGTYVRRYSLPRGSFDAVFTWLDSARRQIVLTVVESTEQMK